MNREQAPDATTQPKLRRLLEDNGLTRQICLLGEVGHPFHVLKSLSGHRSSYYKGPAKNEAQLFSLFSPSSLMLAHKCLFAFDVQRDLCKKGVIL